TKHQFMCGNWLMIAPVYKQEETTEWSFYLPHGKWTDFSTGKEYEGGKTITGYDVSDYKYPIMAREGAIVPMYPESYYDDNRKQQKPRDPLTIDIYPSQVKTQFELMEDDGVTYKFKTDYRFNKTLIECEPGKENIININITGLYEGSGYKGMPKNRNYYLQIHGDKPKSVTIDEIKLKEMKKAKALEKATDGWYFDSKTYIAHIKVKEKKANSSFSAIILRNSTDY
ncbi:uncharacterized protein METZ01_LOCUS321119, partial [marine metagenome]